MSNNIFSKELIKNYKHAFVFGTGGGNDIVSAVLVALYLQKHGIKTDLGGLLSPAATHKFKNKIEKVVNLVKGEAIREIPAKESLQISFLDNHLPKILEKTGIENIPRIYDLSIRYGTKKLVQDFNALVKKNNYDLIVAVDVGGDILARGGSENQDITLRSPVMDFASLYLLGFVDVDCMLVEFGLGTDGELRPEGMKQILAKLEEKKLFFHLSRIKKNDAEFKQFKRFLLNVGEIRKGHAILVTAQTLKTSLTKTVKTIYRVHSQLGKRKWTNRIKITLPGEYNGRVFIIDGKRLADQRKQTAFSFDNPLEQYVRLKQFPSWKTELDLHYLWSGNDWTSAEQKGNCLLLLVPSNLLPASIRLGLFEEGKTQLLEGKVDILLILKEDFGRFASKAIRKVSAKNFYLLFTRNELVEFAETTANKIKEYL